MPDGNVVHELIVMDRTGDTKTVWNPDNEAEVDIAREAFKMAKKKSYVVYRVDSEGGPGKVMHEFDPHAAKMIARPPVVGG